MKPEKFFKSKQQLNRYLYVKEIAEKLIALQDKGCILFDEDGLIEGNFALVDDFDDETFGVLYLKEGNCKMCYVDLSWGDDGRPYIESKKVLKKLLSEFRCVNPSDIVKI